MSKSKGNYVEPHDVIKKYGSDAFRYFLLRENTFGEDGDYSQKAFDARYNGELADELGNLANRTLVMVNRYCDGKIPVKSSEGKLKKIIEENLASYEEKMNAYQFNRALEAVWNIVREANKLVNDTAPWKLAKEGKQSDVEAVMYELCEALHVSSILLYPFMPRKATELYDSLGLKGIDKARLKDYEHGKLKTGTKTAQTLVLFPKIEAK